MSYITFETEYGFGPVWENMTRKGGEIVLTPLYVYFVRGERQYALTEAEARLAVVANLQQEKR